jgi:hypothetical protein
MGGGGRDLPDGGGILLYFSATHGQHMPDCEKSRAEEKGGTGNGRDTKGAYQRHPPSYSFLPSSVIRNRKGLTKD